MKLSILRLSLASIPVLAIGLGACAVDPAEEEAAATESSAITRVAFPDSPRESCDLGIPLQCPSMINFTLTAPISIITGATQTRAISTTAAAAIHDSGESMGCQPALPTVTPGIAHSSFFIPNDTTITEHRDHQIALFNKPVARDAFNSTCALFCDGEAVDVTADSRCQRTSTSRTIDDARVTVNGVTRTVNLTGRIESMSRDVRTGVLTTTCSMSLLPAQVQVQSVRRPNDVIAVSRGRFVRGYELRGTALQAACSSLANKLCSSIQVGPENPTDERGRCVDTKINECVTAFSQPDPCVRVPIQQPR